MKTEVIALYLPQFHPFKENDEWWGKGFTEWTNVGKAKPLFKKHYQPRVPADLGYYDLRIKEVREQQVELAKEAGVTSFCYWHYWFGNGKRLMADIFDEVLETGVPNFPFCLAWANHSWYSKTWNSDGSTGKKLLIEQTYPGETDMKMHFDFLLKAFNDSRYTKISGCPLLYIFDAEKLPRIYVDNLRKWTKEAGFPDIYLVANAPDNSVDSRYFIDKGFNAVTYTRLRDASIMKIGNSTIKRIFGKILARIKGILSHRPPYLYDYEKASRLFITEVEKKECVIPVIIPQWDHSPRSGWNGIMFDNSTPDFFAHHVMDALDALKNKKKEHHILILKSWNEWAEGNYMEPDLKFGKGYIKALKKTLDDYEKKECRLYS